MAESCAESWENNEGGWCEGGFETLMIVLSFFLGLPILFCIFWCYYTKKRDRENLEMIERQDQVIKTYQKAKMIISAFESL